MFERARQRMTSDKFIAWAMKQPGTEHYEPIDCEVVAMAPERIVHARVKAHINQPDAMVRCDDRLPHDIVKPSDPVIVVGVRPPSTISRAAGPKLIGRRRPPPVGHHLIARAESRTIVLHVHGENGIILTRIVRDEPIIPQPPGITLAGCFPPGVD